MIVKILDHSDLSHARSMILANLMFALLFFSSSLGAEEVRLVRVTGYGATVSEARFDAMRTALQQTVDQLIISDRVIDAGDLAIDRVMSTLNGHVASFELVSIAASGALNETVVKADVGVSASSIRNFMSYGKGEKSELDGESLFAELARVEGQSQAIDEMLTNALSEFPSDAFEVTLQSVAPGKAGDVDLKVDVKSIDDYFDSLQELVYALSDRVIDDGFGYFDHLSFPKNTHQALGATRICFTESPLIDTSTKVRGRCGLLPKGNHFRGVFKGQFGVDVGTAQMTPSRPSDPEAQKRWQRASDVRPFEKYRKASIIFALLDEDGKSVMNSSDGCAITRDPGTSGYMTPTFKGSFPFSFSSDEDGPYLYFGRVDSKMTISIPAESLNVASARSFIGALVLISGFTHPKFLTNFDKPPKTLAQGCADLLERAALIHD